MHPLRRHSVICIGLLLSIFALTKQVEAQQRLTNYELEARVHFGYLYFQNDEFHSALARYSRHAPALELSFHRNTYGQHRWEVLHNYPSIGFTFYYSPLSFHNDNISKELGQVFALYPFINFPINSSERSKITFKLGVGLSYLTNKFAPQDGPGVPEGSYHNYAIGSHINAAINLSFEYRQRLANRLSLVTSTGLTHFSNGATKSPNMGINIFSVATGLSWYLTPPKANVDRRLRPKNYLFEFDGKQHFVTDVQYTMGYKDVSQQYGTNNFYLVHDLAANFMFQISERDRLGVGVEVVWDNSDKVMPPFYKAFLKPAGLISYEMMLDRVSFMFNVGIRKNAPGSNLAFLFYQKLGLRYYITDGLFASLSFTTYDIKADFISIGIGYHFQHKYYLPHHEKKSYRSPVFPR